jgi:hypothetical protein
VTKKVKAPVEAKRSLTAQLIETPSLLDVPRPSSSTMTKLLSVTFYLCGKKRRKCEEKRKRVCARVGVTFKMWVISIISFMKELQFVSMWSDVPILVNIRSVSRKEAKAAGTKQPMWLRMVSNAI